MGFMAHLQSIKDRGDLIPPIRAFAVSQVFNVYLLEVKIAPEYSNVRLEHSDQNCLWMSKWRQPSLSPFI